MFIALRGMLFSFALLACVLPAIARDPVQIVLPDKPEEWFKAITAAGAEGKYEVLWQNLPASYQADIKKLLAEFGQKMDPELWAEANKVAVKVTKLLSDKTDFIIGSQLVSSNLQTNSIKPEDAKLVLRAVAVLLSELQSSVATLPQVEKLDVEKLLANLGPKYVEFTKSLTSMTKLPLGTMNHEDLIKFDVKLVSSDTESAKLELSRGDSPKHTIEFVRVEDKWVDKIMATQWTSKIGEARKALGSMQIKPEEKQKAIGYLNMVNGILDGFLNAKTQQEFDASIATVMPLIQQVMPKNLGGPVEIRQQKSQQ